MDKETRYREAGEHLATGMKLLGKSIGISIATALIWAWHWVMSHKLLTALVISVITNIVMMCMHMQDCIAMQTKDYNYVMLEQRYDQLRMANIKFTK